MAVTQDDAPTVAAAVRRAARTRWGRAVVALLATAAAGVAVLGATGGLAEVETGMPTLEPGEPLDVGRLRLTVLDQVVTDEVLPSRLEDAEAEAWLAVRVVAATTLDETLPYLPDVIEAPVDLMPDGADDLSRYPVELLVRDGTEVPQVHPGLPEEIVLLWPLADRTSVPEVLELTVLGSETYFSQREHDWLWWEEEPVARVAVPRGDGVPAVLVEEEDAL